MLAKSSLDTRDALCADLLIFAASNHREPTIPFFMMIAQITKLSEPVTFVINTTDSWKVKA